MLIISILLLLFVVGLLIYALSKNADVKQIGYVLFAGAYLAMCFAWANKVLHF